MLNKYKLKLFSDFKLLMKTKLIVTFNSVQCLYFIFFFVFIVVKTKIVVFIVLLLFVVSLNTKHLASFLFCLNKN